MLEHLQAISARLWGSMTDRVGRELDRLLSVRTTACGISVCLQSVQAILADSFTAPASSTNRVLLMRGLAPDSTQEEIRDRFGAEIVRLASTTSLTTPITDGRAAIQRVILIRNKYNKNCLGFGFIQLASTHLATALLGHLISRTAQPVGFVINSRPVACSFANPNAFADVGPSGINEPWCIPVHNRDRQLPGGIGGTATAEEIDTVSWLKYWDDTCGASELPVALDTQYPLPLDPSLQAFLDGLAAAAGECNPDKEVPASTPGSGSATPLALSAGGIKMVPLKIGKKKEQDAMISLAVGGVEKAPSSRSHASASDVRYLNASTTAANVFAQAEDDEPAALPSKSRCTSILRRRSR